MRSLSHRLRSNASCMCCRSRDCVSRRSRLWPTQPFGSSLFSMVKRLVSCVILLLVSVGLDAQSRGNHSLRFNPSGDYHPENRPADDFGLQFLLQVRYRHGRRVAWGSVPTVAYVYRFKSVSVTEKYLRFSTERHHGSRYDFDGEFLRGGDFTTSLDIPGSLPLRGTLRKYVNGRKVMELNTSFFYYVGC